MAKFYTYPHSIICECGYYAYFHDKPKDQKYHVISCPNNNCKYYGKKYKIQPLEIKVEEIDG